MLKEVSNSPRRLGLFDVTNQKWKNYIFAALLVAQVLLILMAVFDDSKYAYYVLDSLGVGKGAISLLPVLFAGLFFLPWAIFSLRCPSCNSAMVWYIMRRLDHREFITQYVRLIESDCPACGVEYNSMKNKTIGGSFQA